MLYYYILNSVLCTRSEGINRLLSGRCSDRKRTRCLFGLLNYSDSRRDIFWYSLFLFRSFFYSYTCIYYTLYCYVPTYLIIITHILEIVILPRRKKITRGHLKENIILYKYYKIYIRPKYCGFIIIRFEHVRTSILSIIKIIIIIISVHIL